MSRGRRIPLVTSTGNPDTALLDLTSGGRMIPARTVLRAIGTSTEHTTCERCARTGLACTVVLADEHSRVIVRVGTTCAARILGDGVSDDTVAVMERARRRDVHIMLRDAREALEDGQPSIAIWHARTARARGLHMRDEREACARIEQEAAAARRSAPARWGCLTGCQVTEADTLAAAVAMVRRRASAGALLVTLVDGQWARATL